jgi:phospholipase C
VITARRLIATLALLAGALLPLGGVSYGSDAASATKTATPIKHFIYLMQENHTFDNYFGTYPGADGIPSGVCMPVNPFDRASKGCVEPYHLSTGSTVDPDHSSTTSAIQYNKGKMNGFVYALRLRNQPGQIAMGYYDRSDLPIHWGIADKYVLFDKFFSSAATGSFPNHLFWVAGSGGGLKKNNVIPAGGLQLTTIFDRLEAAGVSWKFYVQNYDPRLTFRQALTNSGNRSSQVVWVPLLNLPRFVDNPKLFSHIVDVNQYYEDLRKGTLPSVAFMVPSGASEHPPGSLRAGQSFVLHLINGLISSSSWSNSAFLYTYDDWGGWYDHVRPPRVDAEGYGFRVPALLVSAYAKRGLIDHTQLDFTSGLKFIEENWRVRPVARRDALAKSFTGAFDFTKEPRAREFVQWEAQPTPAQPKRTMVYASYGAALLVAIGAVLAAAGKSKKR